MQTAKRSLIVYAVLIGFCVCVFAWQAVEHERSIQSSRHILTNRGRDITSTLGVVIRAQRRFGIVSKDRLASVVQDLIRPGDVEYIGILGSTGETIVGSGITPQANAEQLRQSSAIWLKDSVTLFNLMDMGSNLSDDKAPRSPAALVIPDERLARAFNSAGRRSPTQSSQHESEARDKGASRPPPSGTPPGAVSPNLNPGTPESAPVAMTVDPKSRHASPNQAHSLAAGTPSSIPPAPERERRPQFGRPPWMSQEEYEAILQKQAVHSLVVTLSTAKMNEAAFNDLLLRSLVCLTTLATATFSLLAWRSLTRSTQLQIQLVKAVEMNTHLKEMNLAAAGLAHETRNPLNLIRGQAHLIAMQADLPQAHKDRAHAIMEEADRVTVQLNEFINYSKPREALATRLEFSRLATEVLRTLSPDIEDKQLTIELLPTALTIEADEQLLRQTLFNLLLNAIQAVELHGKIVIELSAVDNRSAVLEVRDDGPGVPLAKRQDIFKPYVTMRPNGVGLGLAIVHQMVSAHGWQIECLANQPKGAIFRISQIKLLT